jgi:hypothetical protein
MTLDLGQVAPLDSIRLLLWDGLGDGGGVRDSRGYKYRLLTSTDRRTWSVLFDSGDESLNGWQVFHFAERLSAQYIRVHGLWNSANSDFHVVELEAWDEAPPPLEAAAILEREIAPATLALEESDGLPLERTVDAIVHSLEDLVAAHDFLNPKPFRDLIGQLRLQVADVSALERRVDAVRRQLVEPVTSELERSSKYSVWSVRFGAVGVLLAFVSLALYIAGQVLHW